MKVVFACLLVSLACAWRCSGHMIVAMIARLDLLQDVPEAYYKAAQLLSPLDGELTHGLSNTFIDSACWADDAKAYGFTLSSNWHYIDHPYNSDGLLQTSKASDENNLIQALENAVHTLTTVSGGQGPFETSVMLRYLIHFFGDLHQPLHNVEHWSREYPHGDAGGNFVKIVYKPDITNLHKLWDSGVGKLDYIIPRPLDVNGFRDIETWAHWITGNYTRAALAEDLAITDRMEWSRRSYHIAINHAYAGIKAHERPSQEYLEKNWPIIMRQLALGGYRLADQLKSLYG